MANEYIFVEGGNPAELAERVSEWMQKGYHPVGGPLIYEGHGGRIVLQAVVKVESLRH